MMTLAGLTLIVLGWAYQAYHTSKKQNQLQKNFVLLYVTGASLLVIDGLFGGVNLITILNAASVLLGVVVILKGNSLRSK